MIIKNLWIIMIWFSCAAWATDLDYQCITQAMYAYGDLDLAHSFITFLIDSDYVRVADIDCQALADDLHENGHLGWANSLITFLIDSNGNRYLIKQYKHGKWPSIFAVSVCEVVALEIGHTLGVPLNKACLIPAGVNFIGKDKKIPATLHTHAPGIRFDKYKKEKYKDLDLMQRNLQQKVTGLSRDIMYHMSRHDDLPVMVAYDTFIGNFDRTITNLFYDEKTDSFCGIDVAIAFYMDLCPLAIIKIQEFLDDESCHFSDAELRGLKKFTEALEQLVLQWDPQLVSDKIDTYAHYAGFFDDSFFNKDIQRACLDYFIHCKQTFKRSYKNTYTLISLLNRLLEKHLP